MTHHLGGLDCLLLHAGNLPCNDMIDFAKYCYPRGSQDKAAIWPELKKVSIEGS